MSQLHSSCYRISPEAGHGLGRRMTGQGDYGHHQRWTALEKAHTNWVLFCQQIADNRVAAVVKMKDLVHHTDVCKGGRGKRWGERVLVCVAEVTGILGIEGIGYTMIWEGLYPGKAG